MLIDAYLVYFVWMTHWAIILSKHSINTVSWRRVGLSNIFGNMRECYTEDSFDIIREPQYIMNSIWFSLYKKSSYILQYSVIFVCLITIPVICIPDLTVWYCDECRYCPQWVQVAQLSSRTMILFTRGGFSEAQSFTFSHISVVMRYYCRRIAQE